MSADAQAGAATGPGSAGYALKMTGVMKRYGKTVALDGLEMTVPRGSIFGLVGPNGAGKTTTFAIICGFLQADSGVVDLLGGGAFDPAVHRGRVTALPQDAALGRDMPLEEQLHYFGRLQGVSRKDIKQEVRHILEVVDLADRARHRTRTLSHGMLRRLGIGQAFLGNPELVLLDEPTNGLDPRQALSIRNFVESQRGNRTIIISSHNLNEIESMCDHVALIDHGKVKMAGAVAQVTGRDGEVRIQLGEGPVPIEALIAAMPADQVSWSAGDRVVRVRYRQTGGRAAEDVIGQALRVLLDQGGRIASVSRGQSLERAYLESTDDVTPAAT